VLYLSNDGYELHGRFETGQRATSVLLDGFSAYVETVFAAAEQ
jgi:hypothetical protein